LPVRADTGTTAANSRSRARRSRYGSSSMLCATVSTLFTTATTFAPAGTRASTARSAPPSLSASSTSSTTSAARAASVARRLRARLSTLTCLVWKPGAAMNTYWQPGRFRIPVTRWRVVCALDETIASFSPTSLLSRVDLPVLGRPTIATVPQRKPVMLRAS
jgi:hypothetical protein